MKSTAIGAGDGCVVSGKNKAVNAVFILYVFAVQKM